MSTTLRDAAKRALPRGGTRAVAPAITRASVDVSVGGKRDIVSFGLDGSELRWSCTCGRAQCAHASAALEWLAAEEPAARSGAATPAAEVAASPAPSITEGRVSLLSATVRVAPSGDPGRREVDRRALAQALDDVVTSVVRSGESARKSASVDETLDRLAAVLPSPAPLGIERWTGRLRASLATKDMATIARLLHGAGRVADDLRARAPDDAAKRRVAGWLGPPVDDSDAVERIQDRVLVEIAREWVAGASRASIERRYLIDSASGEIFREERARSAPASVSVGPCPRVVTVGLAEAAHVAAPRPVRLLQYTVSPAVSAADWARVAANAVRRFRVLADEYRQVCASFPATAEPFAVVAPRTVADDSEPVPLDDAGDPLPLARADDPAAIAALRTMLEEGDVAWIAGRLVDADGALMLQPASAMVVRGGQLAFRRLT